MAKFLPPKQMPVLKGNLSSGCAYEVYEEFEMYCLYIGNRMFCAKNRLDAIKRKIELLNKQRR